MTDIPITPEERTQYDPITYLLGPAKKSDIPLVYTNKPVVVDPTLPLVVIVFGPGGVGKDTVTQPLYAEGVVQKVKTATSRTRRVAEGESEDYYLWMRQRSESETEDQYVANLVQEYGLLEHDQFNGFVYGTPLENLKQSMEKGTPLLVITTLGVQNVIKSIGDQANIVTVFIVPESFEQLYARVSKREHPDQRLRISLEEIKIAPQLANYYLFNPEGDEGLHQSRQALRSLIGLLDENFS